MGVTHCVLEDISVRPFSVGRAVRDNIGYGDRACGHADCDTFYRMVTDYIFENIYKKLFNSFTSIINANEISGEFCEKKNQDYKIRDYDRALDYGSCRM